MDRKRNHIFIALFFLFIFIFFSFFVKTPFLRNLDFDITAKIQNYTPKSLDIFLSFFSLLGSFEVTFLFLCIIVLFRKRKSSFLVLLIFVATHVVELFGKFFLYHPGPPFQFFRYNLSLYFPSSNVQPGSSYPSGHSLRMIFVLIVSAFALYLSRKIEPKLKYFLYTLFFFTTILMLYSRISLGEHWLSDVVGGMLLGISSGFFATLFL